MSLNGRVASPEQLSYIHGLIGRLIEVTDDAPQLPADEEITRSEASTMIDGLVKAIDRLGGHLSQGERRKLSFGATLSGGLTERQKQNANVYGEPPSRVMSTERAERMERAIAYNDAQKKLFPDGSKGAPYRSKNIVVWQKNPHHMSVYTNHISYGWAWECDAPSHVRRVRGGSKNGYQECMDNAMRHWENHHGRTSH